MIQQTIREGWFPGFFAVFGENMLAHLSYGTVVAIEAVPITSPQTAQNIDFVERVRSLLETRSSSAFRAAIPFEFKDLIENLIFYGRQGEDYRFRVVGSRIGMLMAAEATGKTACEAFAAWPEFRDQFLCCAHKVTVQGCIGGLRGKLHYNERSLQGFETISVPIPDKADSHFLALCHVCLTGQGA